MFAIRMRPHEGTKGSPEQNACNLHEPFVVVVVEWLYYSKRIIIVRWADLSDFIFR